MIFELFLARSALFWKQLFLWFWLSEYFMLTYQTSKTNDFTLLALCKTALKKGIILNVCYGSQNKNVEGKFLWHIYKKHKSKSREVYGSLPEGLFLETDVLIYGNLIYLKEWKKILDKNCLTNS